MFRLVELFFGFFGFLYPLVIFAQVRSSGRLLIDLFRNFATCFVWSLCFWCCLIVPSPLHCRLLFRKILLLPRVCLPIRYFFALLGFILFCHSLDQFLNFVNFFFCLWLFVYFLLFLDFSSSSRASAPANLSLTFMYLKAITIFSFCSISRPSRWNLDTPRGLPSTVDLYWRSSSRIEVISCHFYALLGQFGAVFTFLLVHSRPSGLSTVDKIPSVSCSSLQWPCPYNQEVVLMFSPIDWKKSRLCCSRIYPIDRYLFLPPMLICRVTVIL